MYVHGVLREDGGRIGEGAQRREDNLMETEESLNHQGQIYPTGWFKTEARKGR